MVKRDHSIAGSTWSHARATDVDSPYSRRYDGFEAEFVSLEKLVERLTDEPLVTS